MNANHFAAVADRFNRCWDETEERTGGSPSKEDCLRLLVLLRFQIRDAMYLWNKARDKLRRYEREKKLLERRGITFTLLDGMAEAGRTSCQAAKAAVISSGELLFNLLDLWQAAGATREELFNLCNAHRVAGWKKAKLGMEQDERFSALVHVYCLDYPDDGGDWLKNEVDAPFTHAAREYLLDQMLHTETGRKAAHEALEECFPDLWGKRMHEAADAEGNPVLVDKDGEIVGYINESEE